MSVKLSILFALLFVVLFAQAKREYISDCQQNGRSVFLSCLTELEREPADYYEYMSAVCGTMKKDEIIRMKLSHCQMSNLQKYYFFTVYPDITEFEISGIELETLRSEDFAGARRLERLIASNNRLTQIPTHLFERATKIASVVLSSNLIGHIDDLAFENIRSTLRILNLSKNFIQTINKNVFKGLSALDTLYLSSNSITYIESLAFVDLKNLTWLDLSDNSLLILSMGIFDGLNNLRSLDLSKNFLNQIAYSETPRSSVFTPLAHLTTLNLNHNSIKHLKWLRFLELDHLVKLNVANNKLQEIQDDFNGTANGLKFVDLSRNDIETIHSYSFFKLNRLSNLNISHNKLSEMDPDAFNGCRNLKVLDLSGNGLRPSFKTIFPDVEDVIV